MGLALVVVEEHAGRAVHLRDDDALGAVDDEGAVVGHERDVAHVDVLLLDVLDRARAGLLVDIEHDEAQRHLERRRIGHAALAALVDVVFRRLELVVDEFELRGVGEVGDREHRLEHRLQTLVGTPAVGLLDQQELVVGRLLNLDEVRHLCDFLDFSEELADPFTTGERLCHRGLFLPPSAPDGRRGLPAGKADRKMIRAAESIPPTSCRRSLQRPFARTAARGPGNARSGRVSNVPNRRRGACDERRGRRTHIVPTYRRSPHAPRRPKQAIRRCRGAGISAGPVMSGSCLPCEPSRATVTSARPWRRPFRAGP